MHSLIWTGVLLPAGNEMSELELFTVHSCLKSNFSMSEKWYVK